MPCKSAVVAAVLMSCLAPMVAAQSQRVTDLAVGKLLVAPRKPPDPRFAETVILLAQMDQNGALGLMVNRQTRLTLSSLLDQVKGASKRSDPVFLGGPVELDVVLALLRSAKAPDKAPVVMPNTYLVSSRSLLEKALTAGVSPRELHVYMGYCGWGAGQLQAEVKLGGWYIFNGDTDLVFNSDPTTVWQKLIDRTELKFARTAPAKGATASNVPAATR